MDRGKRYMPSGTNYYPVIGDGHVATVHSNGSVEQPSGVAETMSSVATMNEFIRRMVNTDEPVTVAGIDARNPPELPADEPGESVRPTIPVAGSGVRAHETIRAAAMMYINDRLREGYRQDE